MKQLDINTFHDFTDGEISRRILMEDPVMRVVLVSLRAGQSCPSTRPRGQSRSIPSEGEFFSMRGQNAATWVRAH